MPENTFKLSIAAPAKVNLHLAVNNRRQDGFHDLESVFLAVDFGDILHFDPVPGENEAEIIMEGLKFNLLLEQNIIFKALSLFRSRTGFNQSMKIKVEKRNPPGGGLGGGSSDAASALLALNKLAGSPLSPGELMEMALSLGSDVPFFICQTAAALVTGRGETIEPLEASEFYLVLVNPGFPSDTAAAFRLLDEYRVKNGSEKASRKGAETQKKFEISEALNPNSSSASPRLCVRNFDHYFNDFLPVFSEKERTAYNGIISRLRELGAVYANLSGAGSTCFGVFIEKKQAEDAAAALRKDWDFAEFCCPLETLSM
jgi:4-diphosphocytidyl-2-C-methyl-D-erythritol kinase